MQRYLLGRLAQGAFVLLVVATIVFLASRLSGDPAELLLPVGASQEEVDILRHNLKLDRPLAVQYASFLWNILHGDFGRSFRWDQPVTNVIMSALPNTAMLAGAAFVISVAIGIPMGVLSALRKNSLLDSLGKAIALSGQSMPPFWIGMLLILVFAVGLGVLPPAQMGGVKHLVLPAVTLGWFASASLLRVTRSNMLDVLDSEYIKMARVKGVPERWVVWKHGLKNASVAVVTILALEMAGFMTGAVTVEQVFAWPGMGRISLQAIYQRDFPVIQAAVIIGTALFVAANIVADVLYAYLNPRIRYK